MPISMKDFKKGRITKPVEVVILSFLERNTGKAYTMGEIITGIKIITGENIILDFLTGVNVMNALEILEKDKKISKKNIENNYYYAIR